MEDAPLLDALAQARGRGRDDYPVRGKWFCALLHHLPRHHTLQQTLGELVRNRKLRRIGGMETPRQVPKPWNMTRFLRTLGREPFRSLLEEVFQRLIRRLAETVPELGKPLAGDATHLSARRGRHPAQRLPPQPDGGRTEYLDQTGAVVRVLEWYRYKLHVVCNTHHEVAVASTVTPASRADNQSLPTLV